jgi:hypothetical protein
MLQLMFIIINLYLWKKGKENNYNITNGWKIIESRVSCDSRGGYFDKEFSRKDGCAIIQSFNCEVRVAKPHIKKISTKQNLMLVE